ncbi:FtsX-like permease family protein [Enterococcus faecalis]|nr:MULTISPECIES: FtsX-like permease family protein [Enterococcus]EGO6570697.1 FtsX-like permease family protein [Enterococcus faecalis]EGO7935841.1 FtsX-like permease family protein [Enterococcus faecalis]EGO8278960.1 FtsX-like permease family protein [Enterococcus faecalis]EGO8520718.1 ABC transporter permease [Enterococcus faecalis]EHK9404932.1 FtsX-like permease family protein [Enterococcus faecalis]
MKDVRNMWIYIRENFKKNSSKFLFIILISFVTMLLLTFSLGVIYTLNYRIENELADYLLKKDFKNMKLFLQLGTGVLVGFSLFIIYNTYSIVIQGRKKEFQLLYKLGMKYKKIQQVLSIESFLISSVTAVMGLFTGIVFSRIFLSNYQDMKVEHIPSYIYLIVIASAILFFMWCGSKNLKSMNIEVESKQKEASTIKSQPTSKEKFLSRIKLTLGIILLIVSIVSGYSTMTIILLFTGLILIFDPLIAGTLVSLRFLSLRFNRLSLFVAVEENCWNIKRISSLISTLAFSVMLLVGMLTFFHSVKEAVVQKVDETYRFEHILVMNELSEVKEEKVKAYLQNLYPHAAFEIALSMEIEKENNENTLILTGVSSKFKNIQVLEMEKEFNIKDFDLNNDSLNVLFPSQLAEKSKIKRNQVIDYSFDKDKSIKISPKDFYQPLDLQQVFTSKSALTEYLFGKGVKGIYNTIYLNRLSDEEIKEFTKYLSVKNYDLMNIGDLKEKYKNQAIKQTEMIEAFIYALIFFSGAIILNMFILSISSRQRIYKGLLIIGMKRKALLISMLIEMSIIYILGVVLGWLFGIIFAEGGIKMMEEVIVFKPAINIPYLQVCSVLVVIYLILVLGIILISRVILKEKNSK